MDASEYKEFIFGVLFLKRASDQFDLERERLRRDAEAKGYTEAQTAAVLADKDQYSFYVDPENEVGPDGKVIQNSPHWSQIRHVKESVGNRLNKALEKLEDDNADRLEDVLKHINFNRKVGQRTLDDSTLIDFIQKFDTLSLSDSDFEFPDLLGSAYEYLIKDFADQSGKKGGEFYTPGEVVRLMVQLLEPDERMSIYDPCAGSGGMLIQSRHYVEEMGGNPDNLALAGQELNGGTWSICKINLLLHGIPSADIRNADTMKDPQHVNDITGEWKRFDRVIANPPFSQNYSKTGMKYPERFDVWMPTSGKKADLMFVQHMLASLKHDGRMAVVMPHGVLFRGGEERKARKLFIDRGELEAVIGLPSNLFYGTGIPACILVFNRRGRDERDRVLFINADREYKEGKNQNSLRAEDIEKISHVYLKQLEVDKYSRLVPVSELESEDWNLNIRRYVDNSPPPEPHDVRAHLHGGVPLAEIQSLSDAWSHYPGVRESLFVPRDDSYMDFSDAITGKDAIKPLIEGADGVNAKHTAFHDALTAFWTEHLPRVEAVAGAGDKALFELRRDFLDEIEDVLTPQGILTLHQVRGAFAGYMKDLESDFKSVAASGWSAELIPEQDILESQHPETLAGLERDRARITELTALFAAADTAGEDEDGEGDEDDASDGVLPREVVKTLKANRKELKGEVKQLTKQAKILRQDLKRMDGLFGAGDDKLAAERELARIQNTLSDNEDDLAEIDTKLETHTALEQELKDRRASVRATEKLKDELVASARDKISEDEAKALILDRLQRRLTDQYDGYLRQYLRGVIAAVENLWDKYAVTANDILAARDAEAAQLETYLKELGYE
ncbi:N-6 DNA methylase [bacterium]|nr:N-6 DNA methylase [bacterium]